MAGIIDTIKLAGVLVFAIPAALAGLEFLLMRGEPEIGAALLVLSAGLILIQHRLTLPTDIPSLLAKRAVGAIVPDSDADPDSETPEKE